MGMRGLLWGSWTGLREIAPSSRPSPPLPPQAPRRPMARGLCGVPDPPWLLAGRSGTAMLLEAWLSAHTPQPIKTTSVPGDHSPGTRPNPSLPWLLEIQEKVEAAAPAAPIGIAPAAVIPSPIIRSAAPIIATPPVAPAPASPGAGGRGGRCQGKTGQTGDPNRGRRRGSNRCHRIHRQHGRYGDAADEGTLRLMAKAKHGLEPGGPTATMPD